ncbi:hypothetical protein [Lysinibacillus sp. 54212]
MQRDKIPKVVKNHPSYLVAAHGTKQEVNIKILTQKLIKNIEIKLRT